MHYISYARFVLPGIITENVCIRDCENFGWNVAYVTWKYMPYIVNMRFFFKLLRKS